MAVAAAESDDGGVSPIYKKNERMFRDPGRYSLLVEEPFEEGNVAREVSNKWIQIKECFLAARRALFGGDARVWHFGNDWIRELSQPPNLNALL